MREITLPPRHEDIIRQQAHDKGLDPALIAAVIYAESHFRDGQVSAAGAQASWSSPRPPRGTSLTSPAGRSSSSTAWDAPGQHRLRRLHLRYLLRRYDGNVDFALAAYNAGEGNVDRWISGARHTSAP